MEYMLLIYGAPGPRSAADAREAREAYGAYERALADAGVRLAGAPLHDPGTATTVSIDPDGGRVVTDGPFAETREVIGGYYVLDVPDLDAALDWAARCPGARGGGKVEVRPVAALP